MSAHPIRIWSPSGMTALAAFVFVGGMLFGSPAILVASAGLLGVAVAGAGAVSLMRRFQVLPRPAVQVARRR